MIAVVFALYLGSSVFIPVMLAIVLSYAVSPVVNVLQKWQIPRAVGAALVLLGVPIIMMIKSVCDHVEDLKPVGELLGE